MFRGLYGCQDGAGSRFDMSWMKLQRGLARVNNSGAAMYRVQGKFDIFVYIFSTNGCLFPCRWGYVNRSKVTAQSLKGARYFQRVGFEGQYIFF